MHFFWIFFVNINHDVIFLFSLEDELVLSHRATLSRLGWQTFLSGLSWGFISPWLHLWLAGSLSSPLPSFSLSGFPATCFGYISALWTSGFESSWRHGVHHFLPLQSLWLSRSSPGHHLQRAWTWDVPPQPGCPLLLRRSLSLQFLVCRTPCREGWDGPSAATKSKMCGVACVGAPLSLNFL